METRKYMVISYDDDQQQTFWDMVLAPGPEQAKACIGRVRDYALIVAALNCSDLQDLSNTLHMATPEDVCRGMRSLNRSHPGFIFHRVTIH